MSLIDKTYFVGELDIANTSNASVEARLQWFIDKYEPEFLLALLGAALYANYIAGIVVTDPDPIPEQWIALQDVQGLKEAIACYVYFHYMRDRYTFSTGVGEVKPTAENATQENPSWKITRAWNEMTRWVRSNVIVAFINENVSDYPGWTAPEASGYYLNGVWTETSILWRRFGFINPVISDL
jgi:hypothetical protein